LSRRDKAFSLLELLISIAILSIGITVALQALSFSSRVTGLTLDMVKAVFLAEDKIQELEFYEKQKLTSSLAAEVNESQDKFAWAYRIWPEPEFSLLRLDFEVVWQRANRNEKIELSTYLKP
jgi:prepilin-type N-terminal cleavage/methylation domain-containing protein